MDREKRFSITDPRVEEYIKKTVKPYSGLLEEIRAVAIDTNVPVISLETSRLLEILVTIRKPDRILELGTAVGFTSILMGKGLAPGGKIDTVEVDSGSAKIAEQNIKKFGYSGYINIIVGDAEDVLSNIDKQYDFIFIDAAKGQYPRYYELCREKVLPGGIIFADNVLYRGMTAGGAYINRRQQLLVRRLGEYLETATNDKDFITDIIPIGDGVCISYKTEGQV